MTTHLLRTALTLLAATVGSTLCGASIDGTWKAEIESQVGIQKYVFEFKAGADGKIVGSATWERMEQKGKTELKDIKVKDDAVSFLEPIVVPDMEIRATYTGKLSGDELTLTRVVGEFATEKVVAKRVPAPAAAQKKDSEPTKPAVAR